MTSNSIWMIMKNTIKTFIITVLTGLLFNACVPVTQFNALEEKQEKTSGERDQLFSENEKLTVENTELKARYKSQDESLEKLRADSIQRLKEMKVLQAELDKVTHRYNELLESQEQLVKGNEERIKKLLTDLENTNSDLVAKEKELRQLEMSLNAKKDNLDDLKRELEERNQRLVELESILSRKDSLVKAIRNKVAEALLGFKDEGLEVSMKNGKVYVSLDEKLLFKSGQTDVDSKGVRALKKLAGVLESNPGINIMIEGHTDDVPIKSGSRMQDNWDLSVLRATAIVRILLDNSSIEPTRLTVSGRGEYLPVDPRDTPEARQRNRRTEIILTPNLDELYQILESD